MYNVLLVISYKGTNFFGFQSQPHQRTVYDEVLRVLQLIYKTSITCSFSGRTDSGVHAADQHLNFHISQYIPEAGLFSAVKSLLPNDIQCKSVSYVTFDFDSRFDAYSREYRYRFAFDSIPLALNDYILPTFTMDQEMIQSLGELLIGTHDFNGFSCKGSVPRSTVRTIYHFSIDSHEILDLVNLASCRYYEVVIIGNSFLYKMVRNILGAIFAVCKGSLTESQFRQIVTDGDRTQQFQTIPSLGLCLFKVNY